MDEKEPSWKGPESAMAQKLERAGPGEDGLSLELEQRLGHMRPYTP